MQRTCSGRRTQWMEGTCWYTQGSWKSPLMCNSHARALLVRAWRMLACNASMMPCPLSMCSMHTCMHVARPQQQALPAPHAPKCSRLGRVDVRTCRRFVRCAFGNRTATALMSGCAADTAPASSIAMAVCSCTTHTAADAMSPCGCRSREQGQRKGVGFRRGNRSWTPKPVYCRCGHCNSPAASSTHVHTTR
eukprot:356189-Chlamydomonas_euryale.AAC.4